MNPRDPNPATRWPTRSPLRRLRNRALRRPLVWTDRAHGEASWWTWGAPTPDATRVYLSLLGIINRLAQLVHATVFLWHPAQDLTHDDPRWDEAWLWATRNLDAPTLGYPLVTCPGRYCTAGTCADCIPPAAPDEVTCDAPSG